MKEVLMTSSVLVLALLVLREVFREKISRRVQYALWGLVLLRLLIPVNLPAVDFSVLSAVEPARAQVERQLEENPVYVLPVERQEMPVSSVKVPESTVILPIEGRYEAVAFEKGQTPVLTSYALSLNEALGLAWIVGMGCMGIWMAASNLRFWFMLRKKRVPLELPECKYPVFLVEDGLVSPCLFGVFKPAVYLTPGALEDNEGLKHVLAHEETHGRHFDPVWALLRSVCLVVYWFDPLVWWAAAASKEDCELACDEGALKRLGESQRIPYGQTLLRLIPLQKNRGGALLTATTMTSDKKRMKERIMRIAENKKMKTAALCVLLALVVALCAVTFTGCKADAAAEPDAPDTPVKTDAPTAGSAPAQNLPDGLADFTVPVQAVSYGPTRLETQSVDALFNDGHHGEGHHGQQRHLVSGCHTTENCGTFAWSYDGKIYVSSHDLRLSSFPSEYFLCIDDDNYAEDEFQNVFGYDGVIISYFGESPNGYRATVSDFCTFDENGASLLARVYGAYFLNDLDGDGVEELIGTTSAGDCQLFYQKDGRICEANVKEQVCENWPELDWMSTWYEIMPAQHCLRLTGPVFQDKLSDGTPGGNTLAASRQIAFDGENLTVSAPVRHMTDHLLDGIQELNAVTDAAKAMAKEKFDRMAASGTVTWDDYCVTAIENVYLSEPGQLPGGVQLTAYQVDCEYHCTTPNDVAVAGGAYVYEDGWVGGYFEDEPYLVFRILDTGDYELLENHIPFDVSPPSEYFDGGITAAVIGSQLAVPSEFSGEALFHGMSCDPVWFADTMADWPETEQSAALLKMLDYVSGAGDYEKEQLSLFVLAGYEYSEKGAEVIALLKDLMEKPVYVESF